MTKDLYGRDSEFTIRAYYLSELALCYHPHLSPPAAWRQLRQWIRFNPGLQEALRQAGYVPGCRCFTPRQVECIVRFIGEP
jgi:hypothetical protein